MPGSGMPGDRELARRWRAVAGRLCVLGPRVFGYLRDSEAVALEGDRLTVSVYASIAAEWLPQALGGELRKALAEEWGRPLEIHFSLPRAQETPAALVGATESAPKFPLTRSYTFDDYLLTRGNAAALHAANTLTECHEQRNGQLMIFGDPGVGKTHLLQALTWQHHANGLPAVYLTWTEFIHRFSLAIRDKTIESFKQEIRAARLLAIDDLRPIGGAVQSADELLQAMDWVKGSSGSVIVSAERVPKQLDLPARLCSRLEQGPVARIGKFDREERLTYAARFCERHRLNLPAWAVERICGMEADSVRALQGALNTADMLARSGGLTGEGSLDEALVTLSLNETLQHSHVSANDVLERVAKRYGVTSADLRGKARSQSIRDARAVAVAALTRQGVSQAETGRLLGDRAKQTIHGVIERGEALLAADAVFAAELTG